MKVDPRHCFLIVRARLNGGGEEEEHGRQREQEGKTTLYINFAARRLALARATVCAHYIGTAIFEKYGASATGIALSDLLFRCFPLCTSPCVLRKDWRNTSGNTKFLDVDSMKISSFFSPFFRFLFFFFFCLLSALTEKGF